MREHESIVELHYDLVFHGVGIDLVIKIVDLYAAIFHQADFADSASVLNLFIPERADLMAFCIVQPAFNRPDRTELIIKLVEISQFFTLLIQYGKGILFIQYCSAIRPDLEALLFGPFYHASILQ